MLNINNLGHGVVIGHTHTGSTTKIYHLFGLDSPGYSVTIIKNTKSSRLGKEDIIEIEGKADSNPDILEVVDHNITTNVIDMEKIVEKRSSELSKQVVDMIRCKSPYCISNAEGGVDHIFRPCNERSQLYRYIYREQEFQKRVSGMICLPKGPARPILSR